MGQLFAEVPLITPKIIHTEINNNNNNYDKKWFTMIYEPSHT